MSQLSRDIYRCGAMNGCAADNRDTLCGTIFAASFPDIGFGRRRDLRASRPIVNRLDSGGARKLSSAGLQRHRLVNRSMVIKPGTTARGRLPANTRRAEIAAFVVLAVLIWPVLAVGVVGGYGFIVWLSQIILGPPGPPH